MGLDFDIIDNKNILIDRFPLKWLYNYDNSFFNNIYNSNIEYFINYCNQEITILKLKLDNFNNFHKIKYLDFENKKKYLLKLITETNNDDIVEIFKNISTALKYDTNLDQENYQNMIHNFEHFKLFLEKYIDYKYEISS